MDGGLSARDRAQRGNAHEPLAAGLGDVDQTVGFNVQPPTIFPLHLARIASA